MNSSRIFFATLMSAVAMAGIILWFYQKQEKTNTLKTSVLIVGTNTDYPPFSFIKDNVITGFDIDIVQEIARRLDKKIELKDMTFTNLIPELQLGQIQLIAAGMTPTPERAKRIAFSDPYYTGDPLLIITPKTATPVTNLDELAGKTVVVNEGYNADLYVTKHYQGPIVRLLTPAEGFLAIKTGRADAFVTAQSAAQPFFDLYSKDDFNANILPNTTESYALGLRRDDQELKSIINTLLKEMVADGTLARFKEKWNLQ